MDEIFSGDLIIQAEKEAMYSKIKKATGFDGVFYQLKKKMEDKNNAYPRFK